MATSYELWKSKAVAGYVGRRMRFTFRLEKFIDEVLATQHIAIATRVKIAGQFLRDRVAINLSLPVRKFRKTRTITEIDPETGIETKRRVVRVTVDENSRSKPGEFPRADTTALMKDIRASAGMVEGQLAYQVGTTLDYGIILETEMDRSFLRRTMNDLRDDLRTILLGGQG